MNFELVKMAFSRYYRTDYFTLEEAIEFLWERDLINIGELAEYALSQQNKSLKKVAKNTRGFDFHDKSDSKYVTVSYHKGSNVSPYACISGIQNKVGTLRVMVFEPQTEKNYYFKIPYSVYKPYTIVNDSLKIYFNKDGSPREPKRKGIRYNLWDYECDKVNWSK